MNSRMVAAVTVGLAAVLVTGCASRPASGPPRVASPSVTAPLATAVSGPGTTWAIVRTGGPATGGRFWQLLVRPAGSSSWRLATPPGVADNAGLVVTGVPGGTMTAGFLPGRLLTFSPLAITRDGGAHWAPGLLPAGLTAAPGALASLPDGRLVAITAKGAEISGPGATDWTSLVSLRALAATTAGRACGLTRLTAAAASPTGAPLLAGACSRPGAVGIFAEVAGGWQAAGPALPASAVPASVLPRSPARQPISVIRLVSTEAGDVALISIGVGRSRAVIPAWLLRGSKTWRAGTATSLPGGGLASVSSSVSGSLGLTLSGTRGLIFGAPTTAPASASASAKSSGTSQGRGGFTQTTVSLPAPGATLVMGSGSQPITALVPATDTVAIWQLTPGHGWRRTQTVSVPEVTGQAH